MSKFMIGNVWLLLSMLFGSGSQVVLKAVLNETGPLTASGSMLEQIFAAGKFLHLFAAFAMLVIAFLFWTLSLSRLELSYAYPIACSSALIVALLSTLFLGEVVTARVWVGTVLIVVGTAVLWSPR
jgi:drug/metabolite transporter (DMT)-like permease